MLHIPSPYNRSASEVLAELGVETGQGLADVEVSRRRALVGPNTLREARPRSALKIFLDQFKSSVVGLLAAAAVLSFIFADLPEAIAILAVIAINSAIGFFTEMSAVRSMHALYSLGTVNTRVRRNGGIREVPAADLVPGDIVVLEGGDIVTADLRLLQAAKLQCDESALTGESIPVSKHIEPLEGEPPLAQRFNMAYKGTAIVRGSGEGVVTATGMDSELGKISSLVEEAEEERTPLEKRLEGLARNLV